MQIFRGTRVGRLMMGMLFIVTAVGCAGMAHVDLPPQVIIPSSGGASSQEPPGPDPTRPLNLPDSRF